MSEMYSEEMLDRAWLNVSHHFAAYHGFPDVQEDVLQKEADRLHEHDLRLRSTDVDVQVGRLTLAETTKIS